MHCTIMCIDIVNDELAKTTCILVLANVSRNDKATVESSIRI